MAAPESPVPAVAPAEVVVESGNLLAGLPRAGERCPEEEFLPLLRLPGLRILRIVSTGHTTPADEWYDQSDHEWVLVVKGEGRLRVEGETELRILREGDFIHLPAHRRHRVEHTDPDQPTVWLAIHYNK